MTGKIKALGLAFAAITAMSAVAAGSAQAVSSLDIGVAGAGNATLTASIAEGQELIWVLKSTQVGSFNSNCTNTTLEATTGQGKISEFTATPTYTGCKLFGLNATFQMHGCKYTFTTTATAKTANVDIVGCTAGKEMTIKNLTCTLDIPEQKGTSGTGLAHAVFSNQVNNHVTLEWTVSGIEVTQTGAGCPDGNGHVSDSFSLSGKTTLTAFKDTGTHQVTEHGHQFTRHTHNNEALALTAT